MQKLMRELEGVMSEELGLYVGLLQYAKCKKEALINNDVDEISRLSKLESESLERIKCAVNVREKVLSSIAREYDCSGPVDFNFLSSKLPVSERGEFETLRAQYKQVVEELRALNNLNQNLLRMQLQYTSFCIDSILQLEPMSGTYASSGQIREGGTAARRFIDREA